MIFLHHLPRDLKDLVSIQLQQLEAMELAKFTDVIWDVSYAKKTVLAAISLAPAEEENASVEDTALEKKWYG